MAVTIVSGILVGLVIYLVKISNAPSYLSDSSTTCINCHVMEPQYVSWFHSSHREQANCNDCHVPHNNFINKYYFKGKDGMRHATIFTLRKEPQVIRIKAEGKHVVQENCKRCHFHVNENVTTINVCAKENDTGKRCWDCHRDVPHGTVSSLSSTPNNIVPKLESPVPDWLDKLMNE